MQQVWIIVSITIIVVLAQSYAHNLCVSVTPQRSRFSASQKVEITLKYKNNGPDTAYIYRWGLPNGELEHPLFKVTKNGQNVKYLGRVVKRKTPSAADAIPLASGKEVSVTIDLSQAYDMPTSDKYSVQFEMSADLLLHTSSSTSKAKTASSSKADESVLQSELTTVFAEGRPNTLIETTSQINKQGRATVPTYVGCSSSRISSIAAGLSVAATYSSQSMTYLSKLSKASTRYTTWFGTFSTSNLATLRTHFNKINSVFSTASITFNCGCTTPNTYAYVYPSQPYKIYLCPSFWQASVSGTDSKAGTIIHELSHFTILGGTQDYAYGKSGCQALAKSSPTKAVNNADCHEYFAENTPALA